MGFSTVHVTPRRRSYPIVSTLVRSSYPVNLNLAACRTVLHLLLTLTLTRALPRCWAFQILMETGGGVDRLLANKIEDAWVLVRQKVRLHCSSYLSNPLAQEALFLPWYP